ncbi:MAG: hypothetical protein ACK4KT_03835 [Thermaurantimonas sp.]
MFFLSGITISNPNTSPNNLYSFTIIYTNYTDTFTLTSYITRCCNTSSGATYELVHHNAMNTVQSKGINVQGLLSDPNWTLDKRLHINYYTIIGDNSLTTFDGIKLAETENAIIADNHIEHLASMNDCGMNAYCGIHLHRALNTWVSSNSIENLCYGLYGRDNLLLTRLECNDFISTHGIYFHLVNIGNIGSPGQIANNRWINPSSQDKIVWVFIKYKSNPDLLLEHQ